MNLPDPPILVITDRARCAEALEKRAERLFEGGCRWLSVRENDLDFASRLRLLQQLTEIGRRFDATVGVHRDLAVAGAVGCALHLPAGGLTAPARRQLGGAALIGQSCHTAEDIDGIGDVDYVTVSPVFDSASKPGYGPVLGSAGLRALAARCRVPVIALGGITQATLVRLAGTGIAGVAVMGEAMSTPDPASWFSALSGAWKALPGSRETVEPD